VLRTHRRYEVFGTDPDDGGLPLEADPTVIEEEIILAERNALLRAALAELPPRCRRLVTLLLHDPPLSYAEISEILRIPPGSIGPQRGRCLDRLRRSPQLAGLADTDPPATSPATSPATVAGRRAT
jgi:RNA polymerase sigma factor (sigma-70 family)